MTRGSKPTFELTGGQLCLDFANTVDDRPTSNPKSRLREYRDLLAFGMQSGVLSEADAHAELLRMRHRVDTDRIYRHAIALRERIFRIFSGATTQNKSPIKDILALNSDFRIANAHAVVLPGRKGYGWVWKDQENQTGRLLWEIVRSAIELLRSEDLKLVRQCAGDDCHWLFIDNSRSSNRRWCEMKTCGNRHKAREFYRRKTARRPRKAVR
jgi:predicted RNA-binding Zn ribbon-like protein